MADDELRKGQRGAVACVDLIYRRKKRRRLLCPLSRLIIQVLYGFTPSGSSSVTQLACMMSSDWKSYGIMSGSHC